VRESYLRHEACEAERPRTGSVFIEPTGHTLEVVPPFDGLHAAQHGVEILQRTIAVGTAQGGRGDVRVLRYRGGSHRAWSATLGRCGDVLTHRGDRSNRLAASSPRNHAQFAAVLSLFSSVEVSVRSNSTTKVSPSATLLFRRAEQRNDSWVYWLVSTDNSISRSLEGA